MTELLPDSVEIVVGDGRWRVEGTIGHDGNGAPVVTGLLVRPNGKAIPDGGISADVLRQISVPKLLEYVRNPPTEVEDAVQWMGQLRDLARSAIADHRPRTPYPDEVYALVAVVYLLDKGGEEGDLADRMSAVLTGLLGVEVGRDLVRNWVRAARKRGFLTPAVHGRASAAPGLRLRELVGSL